MTVVLLFIFLIKEDGNMYKFVIWTAKFLLKKKANTSVQHLEDSKQSRK